MTSWQGFRSLKRAKYSLKRAKAWKKMCILLLFLLLVVGGRPREINVTPEASEAFHAARRYQQAGDAQGAEREYKRAIKHSPEFPHALTALADLIMDTGRAAEAEKMYLQVLRSHPTWIAAASSLGFLYMEGGKIHKAVEQLSYVAAINPSASALLNLGAAQKQAGNLPAAIASYSRARQADPAEPRGAYNLGNALYAHGDLTAAIAQAIKSQTFEESYQLSIRTDRAALTFSSTHAVPRIYPTESFAHGLVQQHG